MPRLLLVFGLGLGLGLVGCAASSTAPGDGPPLFDAHTDGRPPDAGADGAPDGATADGPDAGSDGAGSAIRLDAVDPPSGLAQAPLPGVRLTGSGFGGTTIALVGGAATSNCSTISPTELRCDFPAAPSGLAARVDVEVSDPVLGQSFTLPNAFTYTLATTDLGYCNIQFPASTTAAANMPSALVFGQVYQAGLTDANGGPAPGLRGELGFGPASSDPRSSNDWRFFAATPNPNYDFSQNNDEYEATLTVPTPGTYGYVYRFSIDDGLHFTYCDLDGNGSNGGLGFDPAMEGTLTIN